MICLTLGNTSGRTECWFSDVNHLQRVKWIATKQDFHYTAPCSKLCEPSLEEHVEKVDVDDDVDEGESVADQVGESIPENAFGRLPLVNLMK